MATCTSRFSGDRPDAAGGGVVALRDADGDGKFEIKETFGSGSTTGIGLRNGYLYVAHPTTVRALQDDGRTAEADRRARDRSSRACRANGSTRTRAWRSTAAARSTSTSARRRNACQQPDRRPGVKGVDPCPLLEKHGGIWKFDENKLGTEAGRRHAVRDRPSSDAGDHVARRRALHRDEQPRSARRVLARQVHGEGQRRAARRAAVPRRAGIELRLAVLLLRLRPEEVPAQPRVRRRRQGSRPLRRVHAARSRPSRRTGRRST